MIKKPFEVPVSRLPPREVGTQALAPNLSSLRYATGLVNALGGEQLMRSGNVRGL